MYCVSIRVHMYMCLYTCVYMCEGQRATLDTVPKVLSICNHTVRSWYTFVHLSLFVFFLMKYLAINLEIGEEKKGLFFLF